jgi:hypothetical protein
MASAARVQLAIDRKREENDEIQAYESYLDWSREQEEERQEQGIVGKVLGGLVGLVFGGVPGAIAGSTIGGASKEYMQSKDYADEAERYLDKQIFEGGKFNAADMRHLRDTEINNANLLQDAYNAGYLTDAISAAVGIIGAGGFQPDSGLINQVFKGDATFGEYLSTLGGEAIDDATFLEGIKAAGKGVLDTKSPIGSLTNFALTDYMLTNAEYSGMPIDQLVGQQLARLWQDND